MDRLLKIRYWLCCTLCCAALLSCQEKEPAGVACAGDSTEKAETFSLNYTLPDTEAGGGIRAAGSHAVTRATVVPIANERESKVSSVSLLFFERDDYGNGLFLERLEGTVKGNHLATGGTVIFTLGGAINADTDYNVLAIANADSYFASAAYLTEYCKGKTENRVRLLLNGTMPHTAKNTFDIPEAGLPMSGIGVKEAKKDLTLNLLRAAVRIDVKVADEKKGEIILKEATLRNVSSRIPVFNDPKDTDAPMLAYAPVVKAEKDSVIRGGLYLTEVFRTGLADDVVLRSRQAACLVVSCHNKDYTGDRTWYRVDIFIDDEGVQYLRRNNAYTVEITRIKSLGAATPDEAYESDATLIKAVTIPTEWKKPDGMSEPPGVDIH